MLLQEALFRRRSTPRLKGLPELGVQTVSRAPFTSYSLSSSPRQNTERLTYFFGDFLKSASNDRNSISSESEC